MNSPNQTEEAIFNAAKQLADSHQLRAYLDVACAGQPDLRRRLDRLLGVSSEADDFFQRNTAASTNQPAPVQLSTTVVEGLTEDTSPVIAHYKLLQKIGEGGCGVVYMAEQEEPVRRRVALKIIKLGMDTKQVVARFEAERQALAMMDHPNIAKVLDAGTTESGRPFFVMELVRGIKITEYCDEARLSTRERLDLFVQICQAIQHAHQKGIIHRDIKPSNILVTVNDGVPVPKVIDFGIAKATAGQRLTDKTLFTAFEQFIGTPAYMSPEQAVMTSLDIDTRRDIYSLGVLLYELLTGKTPFDAQELLEAGFDEMRRTIREKEPVRPSTRLSQEFVAASRQSAADTADENGGALTRRRYNETKELIGLLRGDLDWIVMKALEKDRTRRYETANGFAADIRRCLNNEPVLARSPSNLYRLQKLIRRNTLAFAASFVVTLTVIAGLSLALIAWRQTRLERDKALSARADEETQRRRAEAHERKAREAGEQLRRSLYVANMKVASVALKEGNRGFATVLVDKYLHQSGANDLRGWEWRYLWKLCQGKEEFTLTGHSSRVVALAFSPDSKTLFSGGGGDVKIWDLASRKELATLRIDTAHTNAVASSPTNQNLFIGWRDPAFIIDLAISPTGQTLVIGSFGGVVVRYGPSFALETERPLPGAKFPLALSPDGQTLVTGGTGTNGLIIWDMANLKKLHTLGQLDAWRVAFSPDRARVAVLVQSGGAYEVMLWNFDSLRADGARARPVSVLQRGTNEFGFLDALAFSRDAQILATAGYYRGIQLWDAKTGLPLSKPESSVEFSGGGIVFLPDGKTLLRINFEQDFRVWDISSRTNIVSVRSIPGHLNEIWSLVLAPNGQRLASGSKDGTIKLWSTDVFQERPGVKDQLGGHRIEQVVFSQDGGTMFTISSNRSFGAWETASLQPLTSYELPRDVGIAVISPQGNQVAAGLTNGAVQTWSVPSRGKAMQPGRDLLPAPPSVSERPFAARGSAAFPLVTWSADGKRLAAYMGELHVWDAVTDQLVRKLPLGDEPYSIALSPNGRILAAGIDQNIELWDLTTGKKLSTCVGHTEYTLELTFSPDGKTLASADIDNTAALWEVPSGKRKFPLTSHTSAVIHLAFSPDGRTLATRSADSVVKLWNVETGRELLTIELPPDSNIWKFGGVRFSSDGSLLAVGILAPEPHIQFYRAASLAEIDALEAAKARKP